MKIRWMLVLLFCMALPPLAAEEALPQGSELSIALEALLAQGGFSVTRMPLAVTSQDVFPFNITVELEADTTTELEDGRTTLIIDITQQDAFRQQEALVALLRTLSQTPHDFHITVLCAAQEQAPAGLPAAESGSAHFARTIGDADHVAAVCVMLGKRRAICTAGRARISPQWLAALASDAFYQARLPFHFPHFFASFYRLGIISAGLRMDDYLANAIPAVTMQLCGAEDISVLKSVCDGYRVSGTELWDSHYLLLPLMPPMKPLFVSESTFVLSALVLTVLALLVLCAFSFTSRNGEREKRELIRAWFMIPITLALSFASILLGQALCARSSRLMTAAPFIQISAKVAFSALAISVVFFIQELLRVPVGRLVYGYIILLVSLCNIFVFSAIDIQLFLPLVVEYLIIYAVHRSIELAPIIVAMLLMLLPFTPYVHQIMIAGATLEIEALIFCDARMNVLLTLLFFPFQIMWLRVLLWFKLYRRAGREVIRRLVAHNSILIGVLVAIIAGATVLLGAVSSRIEQPREERATVLQYDRNRLAVSTSRTTFSNLTTAHVMIEAADAAVRYEVTLSSDGGIPLYDSSYDFALNETTKHARFLLPDYPPRRMTIDYAFSPDTVGTFSVTALFPTSAPRIYRRETRTVTIAANGGDGAKR